MHFHRYSVPRLWWFRPDFQNVWFGAARQRTLQDRPGREHWHRFQSDLIRISIIIIMPTTVQLTHSSNIFIFSTSHSFQIIHQILVLEFSILVSTMLTRGGNADTRVNDRNLWWVEKFEKFLWSWVNKGEGTYLKKFSSPKILICTIFW